MMKQKNQQTSQQKSAIDHRPQNHPNILKVTEYQSQRISTVFQKTNVISRVQLELSSPQEQLRRFTRRLPNGEIRGMITAAHTLKYRTLKPYQDGLFCQKTFGPVKDFICACGKKQKNQQTLMCSDCGVEYVSSKSRRYRMGFIYLVLPMIHIWYLKGRPSYLSLLLDMKRKHVEAIVYATTAIIHSYHPEFAKRICSSRSLYNDHYFRLRSKVNARPLIQKSYESSGMACKLWFIRLCLVYKADDFWVRPTTMYGYVFDWTKKHYLKNKPFLQIPLIRDHYSIQYQTAKNLEKLEGFLNYLFSCKRTYGILPVPKYKKVIKNSMICKTEYEFYECNDVFRTGGLAFVHLFSKIDCFRFRERLFKNLKNTKRVVVSYYDRAYKRNEKIRRLELKRLKFHRSQIAKGSRRIKLLRIFHKTGSRPEWMLLHFIPVLPPDLRPIIKLPNNQLAVSDLNKLYQRIFHRNRHLSNSVNFHAKRMGRGLYQMTMREIITVSNFQNLNLTTRIFAFQIRLLQEAIDILLETGKKASTPNIFGSKERAIKSIADLLKGKTGRFRQNLLGKRVDYSGRSVIVVGPTLKLHECGLPKEIALELFQILLIGKLMDLEIAPNIVFAKQLIRAEHPIIWPFLDEIMLQWPILLNRAPTLHRLGVQAFIPKLVRGKAILLHPLVCPAFNADFDGDQMGVHLPLSIEARSEAYTLMLSTQNILSPAIGEPILTPSQDMVLGCYYLTTIPRQCVEKSTNYFSNIFDVYKAYLLGHFHAHDFVWLRWKNVFYTTEIQNAYSELRIRGKVKRQKKQKGLKPDQYLINELIWIRSNYQQSFWRNSQIIGSKLDKKPTLLKDQYIRTTVGRVLFNLTFQETIHNRQIQYQMIPSSFIKKIDEAL